MSIVAMIAVIPVLVGPEPALGLSAIGAEISAAARWRPAVSIVDQEALFVRDPSYSARVRNCGADVACLAEALAPHGLSHALLVVVNTAVSPPHVAVRALDVRGAKIVAEEVGETRTHPADVIRERTAKLFDALGFREAGRIAVAHDGEGAAIDVSPPPLETIAADQFWVAPGHYRVTVTIGDRRASTELDVKAGEQRVASLDLTIPPQPLIESPWLWAGVGAGVAVIAAGIIFAALGRGTDVCLGPAGTDCP